MYAQMHGSSFKIVGLLRNVLCIMLLMVAIIYTYNDNVAYLKMNFLQEQTISYYNHLITRIRGTEGYSEDYSIVWGGKFEDDHAVLNFRQFDTVRIEVIQRRLIYST